VKTEETPKKKPEEKEKNLEFKKTEVSQETTKSKRKSIKLKNDFTSYGPAKIYVDNSHVFNEGRGSPKSHSSRG
jgi:hypothetical protein